MPSTWQKPYMLIKGGKMWIQELINRAGFIWGLSHLKTQLKNVSEKIFTKYHINRVYYWFFLYLKILKQDLLLFQ